MIREGTAALPDISGIPGFWNIVRASGDRCLVLDYDGTLAEFREDRMSAFPLDGVVDLLLQIRDRTDTHLAIMTGRPLSEIMSLMGDLRILLSGSQGTELRQPDGTTQTYLPSERQQERLSRAEAEALRLARFGRVERKISSVGLHTRGVDMEVARREEKTVCEAWSDLAAENDLECRRFKGGVELRLLGIDKGTALAGMLRDRPADGLCVYVGDDLTDEDAFRVLRDRGYGIKVGSEDKETEARGRLDDPRAVREFLKTWLSVTSRE